MTAAYLPGDDALFSSPERLTTNLLRDRYTEPPFSVLDRRGGAWIERDRRWKALGIQSEVGRAALAYNMPLPKTPQTSTFSPTLCELTYRWYSAPGAKVLDPFAGGSVRGVVAGAMGRHYLDIELREAQLEANRAQASIAGDIEPRWIHGDSARLAELVGDDYEADLVFSCPPYAHLERYSDDPADLSTMPYPAFLEAYRGIIAQAAARLRRDRFAVWVIGEVREQGGHGACVGLVPDTIAAFRSAGLDLYNDCVILTPIGNAAMRTPRQFDASRKTGRVHEYLLVFVKGDARRATAAAKVEIDGDPIEGTA